MPVGYAAHRHWPVLDHAAGHAVVARFLDHHDTVHKITIVGRGRAGGYTRFLPCQERHYQTRSQFAASLASALGGHAAETVIFGELTTGASSDLEPATRLARRRVTEFGMTDRLGVVRLVPGEAGAEHHTCSERTAQAVDEEVRRGSAAKFGANPTHGRRAGPSHRRGPWP